MSVMPEGQGKRAVTHYNVLDHLNKQYNFIECHLETGRTHQIRVHMSYINHPLLGDEIYGPATPAQLKIFVGRLFMHGFWDLNTLEQINILKWKHPCHHILWIYWKPLKNNEISYIFTLDTRATMGVV